MKTVRDWPPNIDTIASVMPQARTRRGVIFTYGNAIYNPHGSDLSGALIAHEQVHSERQGKTPDQWWDAYLNDIGFRFNEELLAHIAEYRWWLKQRDSTDPMNGFRTKGAFRLAQIAGRLSSSLYGGLVSYREATRLLKEAAGGG